jgi:hypothetical protein
MWVILFHFSEDFFTRLVGLSPLKPGQFRAKETLRLNWSKANYGFGFVHDIALTFDFSFVLMYRTTNSVLKSGLTRELISF